MEREAPIAKPSSKHMQLASHVGNHPLSPTTSGVEKVSDNSIVVMPAHGDDLNKIDAMHVLSERLQMLSTQSVASRSRPPVSPYVD